MKPMETTPTIGQKSSSKKKKTLREAMMALRTTTAHTASHSARQLNEDLLELGLADLHVAHDHAVAHELAQQDGQALLHVVDGALEPAVAVRGDTQDAVGVGEPRDRRRGWPRRHYARAPVLGLAVIRGGAS